MTRSLRSVGIKLTSSLLQSSPSLTGAFPLYFRPRSCGRLCLFPSHRRIGSHVPHKSLAELRAAYMPDVARAVSGIPRADSGRRVTPVLTSPNPLSTLLRQYACARLSQPCLLGSCPNVPATFTTIALTIARWLEISA